MRIAICDDEPKQLAQTFQTIDQIHKSLDILMDEFHTGKSLLDRLSTTSYDLIILDIEMPEMNGIQVARKIREFSEEVEIVFLTSHIEYALEGYEVKALRYMTKPIQPKKMEELLLYLLEKEKSQKKLVLKTKSDLVTVNMTDIFYFEAQNHDLRVVTKHGEYTIRAKLSDYENHCANMGFYRIHRGYLIHLASVTRIRDGMVHMTNGDCLPISRGKEKATKEALHLYIQEVAF